MKKNSAIRFVLGVLIAGLLGSCGMFDDEGPFDVGHPGTQRIDGQLVMTFYVSPSGNDRTFTKGTRSQPLRSVQSALSRITVDFRNDDSPDLVIIKVQRGMYTPGNGLSTRNMGLAVLGDHYSFVSGNPEIIIEGGYDSNWNPPNFAAPIAIPASELSILDGEGQLHHVLYLSRQNVTIRGFLIRGGNARNEPEGVQAESSNEDLWKYGGGMFAIVSDGLRVEHLYFEQNRADYSQQGTAAMIYRFPGQTTITDYQFGLYLAAGQTLQTRRVISSRIQAFSFDGEATEFEVANYHVTTDGVDSPDRDGSQLQPFASIQYALDRGGERIRTDSTRIDSIYVRVQRGLYTRGNGLRADGNVGFYVNEEHRYPNSDQPMIAIEGGYDAAWTRPSYSSISNAPRTRYSVLDGGGDMQHVMLLNRGNLEVRGFVVTGGNANDDPQYPDENFDGIFDVHRWKYGGGMFVRLYNGVRLENLYFEGNRSDYQDTARAFVLVKSTSDTDTVVDYNVNVMYAPGQTWNRTSNVNTQRVRTTLYVPPGS